MITHTQNLSAPPPTAAFSEIFIPSRVHFIRRPSPRGRRLESSSNVGINNFREIASCIRARRGRDPSLHRISGQNWNIPEDVENNPKQEQRWALRFSKEKEEFCETDDKATQSTDLGICGGLASFQVDSNTRWRFIYVYLHESI